MSFDSITEFEKTIADYFNAPFAVATDSCTHAIELCLRYKKIKQATCPARTYLSVPMTFEQLGIDWKFTDTRWQDYYHITDTIIDAAVFWKEGGYIPNTFMCISFQFRKHLNLGRGGMILLDDSTAHSDLIKMSYDGRTRNIPWKEQDIDILGYHYYMTPETAEIGLEKFADAKMREPKICTQDDYPNLTTFTIFEEKNDNVK
jgi:dTDP-4-amino-4,6-dideoxygalactose transaminase